MVNDNRRLWKYIVFSALTGGIYSLYFIYKMAQDINVICAEDGKRTAGLAKYVLFSICTLGIYAFIWHYQLENRIKENASRYDIYISETGKTVILWAVPGFLLLGIGPFISYYIIIKNMNALASGYLRDCCVSLQDDEADAVSDNNLATKENVRVWLALLLISLFVIVGGYASYYFSWIPQGKDLSVCVGKKIGTVKLLHPVKSYNNMHYEIGDYTLVVNPTNDIVMSLFDNHAKKKSGKQYTIKGVYCGQQQKAAESIVKKKYKQVENLGYESKKNPNYFLEVKYTDKKISGIILQYWKKTEREQEWIQNAQEAASKENYKEAIQYYRSIRTQDVTAGLDECWYGLGKKLYAQGAYLDAEEYFSKIKTDTYTQEKEKYIKLIDEVKNIFALWNESGHHRDEWYDYGSGDGKAHFIFDENAIEKNKKAINTYTVLSWSGKGKFDGEEDTGTYKLKVKRLSDNKILDATLDINVDHIGSDAEITGDLREYTVSKLQIITGYDVMNVIYNGQVRNLWNKPITETYMDSEELSESYKALKEARQRIRKYTN